MVEFTFYTNTKTHIIYDVRSHTNTQTDVTCNTGKTIDTLLPYLDVERPPPKMIKQVLHTVYRTIFHTQLVTTTLAEAHYHFSKAAIKATIDYKGDESIFLNSKFISGTGVGMGEYAGKIYLVKIYPQKNHDGNIIGYKHCFIEKL
jgi:hypothetical protein